MDKNKYKEIVDTIQNFYEKNSNGVVILWGTTATGKTEISIKLAKEFPFNVISSDSRQIFKYMDIGTDKISLDIRKNIKHYQIDIVNPDEQYTAGQWYKDTKYIIYDIFNNDKLPIIVGGTGLYIDTIYKNFDMPEVPPNRELRKNLYKLEESQKGFLHSELKKIDPISASKIHPNSLRYIIRALEIFYTTGLSKSEAFKEKPVDYPLLMLGLRRESKDNDERIYKRVKNMISNGLIEEVEFLLKKGYGPNLQSMQGIGYKQTILYLNGFLSLEELIIQITRATTRYAKKQRTWLRKYIRDSKKNIKKRVFYKIIYI